MKIKIIFLLALCAVFFSCKTTPPPVVEKFTVSLRSPQVVIGDIEFQFDPFLSIGKITKETASVIYFPREDAVCLQYRQAFFTYHQFWSADGRQAYSNALQKYNTDFEERKLNQRAGRRERRKYGATEGFLIWQQMSFTVQASGNMNVEFGYAFSDRSPYFIVNQLEAEFIEPNELLRDHNRTSMAMAMFFTRAQAAELEKYFDQQLLDSIALPAAVQTEQIPQRRRQTSGDEY